MNSKFKHKWGYKGTETTINGLVKWLDTQFDFKVKLNDKMEAYFHMIIAFGVNELPKLKPKGQSYQQANQIAKKINEQNSFDRFVQFIKNNYNVLEEPRTTRF